MSESGGLVSFFAKAGAIACASLAATAGAVAWLAALGLPWLLGLIEPADPDLPWRSMLVGFLIGGTACLVQLVRIARAPSSVLASTLAIAGVATVAQAGAELLVPTSALAMLVAMASATFSFFSALHLGGVVFQRVFNLLKKIDGASGLGRVLAAASSLFVMPVCGVAVGADELAAVAEPVETMDGSDVKALLVRGLSAATKMAANDCLEKLDVHRQEAIAQARRWREMDKSEAEDIVGGVMYSVCVPPKNPRDLKRYFFGAVKKRANNPSRAQLRWERAAANCPAPQKLAPEPDEALDESWIRAQIAALPEQERRAVELYYFEGLTLEQAAVQLNVSKSTVARLKDAAKARLLEAASGCVVATLP